MEERALSYLFFLFDVLFSLSLAYYLINNLQWYNYSLLRVLTKHHKKRWHVFYFLLPLLLYCVFEHYQWEQYFYFGFFFLYLPCFLFWIFKLDKPLKWTGRVWRFFGIFLTLVGINVFLQMLYGRNLYSFLSPFIFSVLFSDVFEFFLFNRYKKIAQEKIASMTQCKIILITASYGKTSIKNYLAQILKARYLVHSTPRSVNTFKGIIADINNGLDRRSDFYIIEAGARQKGDIAEIAEFLNPHYVLIGKIGPQHLEYFGSVEAIIQTKFEAIRSHRLRYALIQASNSIPQDIRHSAIYLSGQLKEIKASLEGTTFDLMIGNEWHSFKTSVLGSFNAYNIALCIEMANQIGMGINEIINRTRKIQGVEHRLNKIYTNGKLILDDSFNGNIEGMKEAIRISSEHQGRKVIVTPGVIESTEEINIALAQEIDQVFDLVIITGELNAKILSEHIKKAQKIILKDKSRIQDTLKACIREGDLILFANDAPNYI